jgi:hypothetical protein
MYRFLSTAVFMLLWTFALAQPAQPPCDCPPLLQEAIQKVSTIYAGFDDKITPATRGHYTQYVSQLRQQAAKAHTERACYEVLRQYTDFFKDSHVGTWYSVQSSAARLRRVPLPVVTSPQPASTTGLEGIWATADKKQRFAICKDPSGSNQFLAVTLASPDSAWVPGMVKVEFYGYNQRLRFYQGLFYQPKFSGMLDGFTLTKNRLDHWFGPSWYRQNSSGSVNAPPPPVAFKVLNQDFIYLRLAKFNQPEVQQLDSLLKANRAVLHRTRNVIVDLRGNPGGGASSSDEMIRLIYTKPLIYPAWRYRSSPEFIKATQEYIGTLKSQPATNQWILDRQQALLVRLQQHPGQLVSGGGDITRTVDSVSTYPQRVAFLLDEGCGSSTEFFTFEGKQSQKVTTFGRHTYGVMDYGEDQAFPLACGHYVISIPWGRNGWIERFGYRIDNVGFSPDVKIPPAEPDWVQFVMRYWSK